MAKIEKILIKVLNETLRVAIFVCTIFGYFVACKFIPIKINRYDTNKTNWGLQKMPSVNKFLKQDAGANAKILLFFHLHRFC